MRNYCHYLMALLMRSPIIRVIGVDPAVVDPILAAAEAQVTAGVLTQEDRDHFDVYLAYGEGWPMHHHHMHLSLAWEAGYEDCRTHSIDDCEIELPLDGAH